MKRQMCFQQFFGLIILFIISMLLFGCGNKDIPKIQSEKAEGRLFMFIMNNRIHTDTASVSGDPPASADRKRYRRATHNDNTSDTAATPYVPPAWHKELARAFSLVFNESLFE